MPENKPEILIAEDHPEWEERIGRYVEWAGGKPTVVKTTGDAKEQLERKQFNGLITDGLEGEWQELAGLANEKGSRVLVLSGTDEIEVKAREAGFHFQHKQKGKVIKAVISFVKGEEVGA